VNSAISILTPFWWEGYNVDLEQIWCRDYSFVSNSKSNFGIRKFQVCDVVSTYSVWKTWGDRSQSNWPPPGVGFRWVCGYGDGRSCMFLLPMSSKPSSHLLKIQKGVLSARSGDIKSLKGVVLDWITPSGMSLVPSLSWNVKTNQGFHYPVTGGLLCPAGLNWNDPEQVPYIHPSPSPLMCSTWLTEVDLVYMRSLPVGN